MAHFAEINADNDVVLRCIVVSEQQCSEHGGEDSVECEQWVKQAHANDPTINYTNISDTYWKRTSINTYAGKHWTIDPNFLTDPNWKRTDERFLSGTTPTHGQDNLSQYFTGEKPLSLRPPYSLSADQSKAFRGNMAVLGGTYDKTRDVFLGLKAYPSFVLDEENYIWWHSVPMPTVTTYSDGRSFSKIYWLENALEWRGLIFNANQDDVAIENKTIEIHQKWNKDNLIWEDL
jgi:hypothetical protein